MKRSVRRFLAAAACAAAVILVCFSANAGVKEKYSADRSRIDYVLEDGKVAPEHWEKKAGNWYYYTEDGSCIKDNLIVAYDDKYYYLDASGKLVKSTERKIHGITYTIDSKGVATVKKTEDEAEVEAYAAELAAEITKDCKTDQEKVSAIFNYCYNGVLVNGTPLDSDGQDLLDGAMTGFDRMQGNCFTQASMCHYLLQAVGIKDMLVGNTGTSSHWWNLVKIGDSYRHVDCTPFNGFTGGNQTTTKELKAKSTSDETKVCHTYDEGNYPKAY